MKIDDYILSFKKVAEETFKENKKLPALSIQIYLQIQMLETLKLILDSLDKRDR